MYYKKIEIVFWNRSGWNTISTAVFSISKVLFHAQSSLPSGGILLIMQGSKALKLHILLQEDFLDQDQELQ